MSLNGNVTQQVIVGGQTVFVRDMAIRMNAEDRITTADFIAEESAQTSTAIYNSLYVGNTVIIKQAITDGATTDQLSVVGQIIAITNDREKTTSLKRVKIASLEHQLTTVRFARRWESVTASTLVTEALTDYAPASLAGLPLVIDSNATIIEEYESVYDSLYDLLQTVCRITGWAWKIDINYFTFENGIYFFDPTETSGPTLEQPLDVIASTLQVTEEISGVYNHALMPGYKYEYAYATRFVQAGQCVQELYLNDPKYKTWELSNLSAGQLHIEGDETATGSYSDDGVFRLDQGYTTLVNTTIRVELLFRQAYWIESTDETSIATYGRRTAPPLPNTTGLNMDAAKQILDQFLVEKAYPRKDVSCYTRKLGFRPDTVCQVTISSVTPAISAEWFYIKSVTRTTHKTEVTCSLELTTSDGNGNILSVTSPDPAVDMARRIGKLERNRMNSRSGAGAWAASIGPVSTLPKVSDTWAWSEETENSQEALPIIEMGVVIE